MNKKILIAASALMFQAACAATPDQQALRRVWQVEQFPKISDARTAELKAYIDLTALPQAHAQFGCNTVNFELTLSGKRKMRIGQSMSTLAYCEGAMEMEEAFQTLQPHIRRYRLQGDTLTLYAGRGRIIRLRAVASAPKQAE